MPAQLGPLAHVPGGLEIDLSGEMPENVDIDSLQDKPWQRPDSDLTDYFNYGFTENTWRLYCKKQQEVRLEQNLQSKIKVFDSSQPDTSDMPAELRMMQMAQQQQQPGGGAAGGTQSQQLQMLQQQMAQQQQMRMQQQMQMQMMMQQRMQQQMRMQQMPGGQGGQGGGQMPNQMGGQQQNPMMGQQQGQMQGGQQQQQGQMGQQVRRSAARTSG